jgi:xylan 1,4-beta-xylosidase
MRRARFRHVRFHGLPRRHERWCASEPVKLLVFNADQIFDFLLSIGMKPFVELSFMPGALASGATTVFHYRVT